MYCERKISVGQDWMVFSDELQQQVAHSQNYIFIGYLPYLSVAFHFLFAAPSKSPIHYPNTNYEVHTCTWINVAFCELDFRANNGTFQILPKTCHEWHMCHLNCTLDILSPNTS